MPWNPELLLDMACVSGCCTTFVGAGIFAATSRWAIRRSMRDVSSNRSNPGGEALLRQERRIRRAQQAQVLPPNSEESIAAQPVVKRLAP